MPNANTIAELAVAMPSCIPVLERLRIDYCCHGEQRIEQACSSVGITTDELMNLISNEPSIGTTSRSWSGATLGDMMRFIIDTHHAYTRRALQTLQGLSEKVRDRHGDHHPELVALATLVAGLVEDLLPHMMKEEQILFPYLDELESAIATGNEAPMPFFGTARNPIRMLMLEHEAAGEKLAEIRSMTNGFALPPEACTSFMAYYNLFQELEGDLHSHIHLENNILFPRAVTVEENAPKAMTGANW